MHPIALPLLTMAYGKTVASSPATLRPIMIICTVYFAWNSVLQKLMYFLISLSLGFHSLSLSSILRCHCKNLPHTTSIQASLGLVAKTQQTPPVLCFSPCFPPYRTLSNFSGSFSTLSSVFGLGQKGSLQIQGLRDWFRLF